MTFIIAQCVSIFTIILTVLGLIFKSKWKTMICFMFVNLSMLITYFLLGRTLGALLVLGALIRTFVYFLFTYKNKQPKFYVMLIFVAYYLIVSIFLWKDVFDLFMLINLLVVTYTTRQENAGVFRIGYLCSSLLLVMYDIFVCAYVNIVAEVILLVYNIVQIYNYDIKNKIKDVILSFYSTIAPSYHMTIENKNNYYVINSKSISDEFNNFVYLKNLNNYKPETINNAQLEMKTFGRRELMYLPSFNSNDINKVIDITKKHPVIFHDVWMKLRSGYNTKYKHCLLQNVTFKECNEKEAKDILEVFDAGFINVVGDACYKYSEEYLIKYQKILKENMLKQQKIVPYMAYYNGKPISLLFIYKNYCNAFICQITTLLEYRRQGVASALIRYAIEEERKHCVEEFFLVTEKYTYLESFYLKNNFEEIAQGCCVDISDLATKAMKLSKTVGINFMEFNKLEQSNIMHNINNSNLDYLKKQLKAVDAELLERKRISNSELEKLKTSLKNEIRKREAISE